MEAALGRRELLLLSLAAALLGPTAPLQLGQVLTGPGLGLRLVLVPAPVPLPPRGEPDPAGALGGGAGRLRLPRPQAGTAGREASPAGAAGAAGESGRSRWHRRAVCRVWGFVFPAVALGSLRSVTPTYSAWPAAQVYFGLKCTKVVQKGKIMHLPQTQLPCV